MEIVEQSVVLLTKTDPKDILDSIESAARVSYKSSKAETEEGQANFIRSLIKKGHESVLEHESLSYLITCDRGISHELVRHRLASYTQESTRYCNYSKGKFGKQISLILPTGLMEMYNENAYHAWRLGCESAEIAYFMMLENGVQSELARSVLPTCLATTVVTTANLREWRHIFKLRTAKDAHPQMREIMERALDLAYDKLPVIFEDLKGETK